MYYFVFIIFYRFLSTCDSFTSIAPNLYLRISNVAQKVQETGTTIWDTSQESHMPVPSEVMCLSTAKFPCIGAVDEKHTMSSYFWITKAPSPLCCFGLKTQITNFLLWILAVLETTVMEACLQTLALAKLR